MKSFQWSDIFVTGLGTVDDQHHQLIDLINTFGDELAKGRIGADEIRTLLGRLVDYTRFHFSEEEMQMRENHIDARHLVYHVAAHKAFFEEVEFMQSGFDPAAPATGKQLFDFLNHWLAYHILGVDQNMARQMHMINSGLTPAEAYDKEEREADQTTEPLLVALNGLFDLVSQRNRELMVLNQTLEEKVAQRTRELSESNRHLEELSLTDVLTQLPNRRHAMRALIAFWREAWTTGEPVACMMIDADHFKEVNDSYGHDAGDEVLIALARALRQSFRTDDVVCRLGGDEFFVICPSTDLEGAMLVAEKTRAEVASLRVPTGGEPWVGSISIGVAVSDDSMHHYEQLLKLADEAVYAAKRAGKNCVRNAADG
jgi:hemerythrin